MSSIFKKIEQNKASKILSTNFDDEDLDILLNLFFDINFQKIVQNSKLESLLIDSSNKLILDLVPKKTNDFKSYEYAKSIYFFNFMENKNPIGLNMNGFCLAKIREILKTANSEKNGFLKECIESGYCYDSFFKEELKKSSLI